MNPEENTCNNKKGGGKDQAVKHFLYQNILKKNFILFNIFKGGKNSNNEEDICDNQNDIEDMCNISRDINNNNNNNMINIDRNINDTSDDVNYTNNLYDINKYNNDCNIYENNKEKLFDNDYSGLVEENDQEVFSFFDVYNNNNNIHYHVQNSDIILNNEDEEYILFLKYIYNDLLSFIESNKDYYLNNSNYGDMEDLIINICGTICHKAFNNIKTIFNTYEEIKKRKNNPNPHMVDNYMVKEENINDNKYIHIKNNKKI